MTQLLAQPVRAMNGVNELQPLIFNEQFAYGGSMVDTTNYLNEDELDILLG